MKLNLPTMLLCFHLISQITPITAQDWTAAERYSSPSNSLLGSTSTALAADGSQYVVGNFQNMACFDTIVLNTPTPNQTWGYLLKLDAQMQPVWAKAFPEVAYDVSVDAESHVLVAGAVRTQTSSADSLAHLAKYNGDGILLHVFTAAGTATSWGKVVRSDASGNCYLAGERFSGGTAIFGTFSFPPTNSRECFVLKLNPDLSSVLWASYTGHSSNLDNVYDLEVDDLNGFVYASGNFSQNFSFGCLCYNGSFFVEKHNAATGAQVWSKVFSGGSGDVTKQFARLSPDGLTLAVAACYKNTTQFEPGLSLSTGAGNTDYHIYLAEVNASNGTAQWAKKISTTGDSYLWRMARKQDEIWLFGHFLKQTQMGPVVLNPAGRDVFLTKVSANGAILEAERLFGNSADWGYGLAQRDTILAVSGASSSTNLNIGSFVLPGGTNSAFVARKGGLPQLPPIAGFAASPANGCAPLTVQFNNTSYQSATTYLWSFPGGIPGSSTAKNPSVTYNTPGNYTVTLRVTNGAGSDTLVQTGFVQVAAAGPSAAFSTSANGLELSFSHTAIGATSYFWDFGDGQTSTEPNPVHNYADCGTYEVVLTTSNPCGTATAIETITAGGDSPTANFESATNGLSVAFFNQSSNANSFLWDFGDGQTSTEPNPVHAYADCGTYEVVLTTSNPCGTATAIETITAGGDSPTANFGSATNGLSVAFFNQSSNASSFLWDFGDGQTSTEQHPVHAYANCGTYEVVLTSANACGTASAIEAITVGNGVPTAGFGAVTDGLLVGLADYSTNAVTYFWDFGDGQTSTVSNPMLHMYADSGTYLITLIVGNSCGSDTFQQSVTTLPCTPPVVDFGADKLELCVGETVLFSNLSTNAGMLLWTFPGGAPMNSTAPLVEVNYELPGVYAVVLNAVNACGNVQTIKTDYILVHPKPTADFEASVNGPTVVFDNLSEDATSYLWDFGDGQSSSLPNPIHTYTANGNYPVTLTASNDCGSVSFSTEIQISLVGTDAPFWLEQARVFPNPTAGQFWVEMKGQWTGELQLRIVNASGQVMRLQRVDAPGGIFLQLIDLGDVPAGVYWLQVRAAADVWVQRLLLSRP